LKKEHTPLNLNCSFCGKSHREVRLLIAAPKDYICNECVKRFTEEAVDRGVLDQGPPLELAHVRRKGEPAELAPEAPSRPTEHGRPQESGQKPSCAFCGGPHWSLGVGKYLLGGPSAYICDCCLLLCNDILAEEAARQA